LHKLIKRFYELKPGNYSLVLEAENNDDSYKAQQVTLDLKTTSLEYQ
jgi:hypothetical protein